MLFHRLEDVIGPIVDADIADKGNAVPELGCADRLIDPFAPGVIAPPIWWIPYPRYEVAAALTDSGQY